MAQGSRVCPNCGGLNGIDEETCYRCGKRLPGAVTGAFSGVLQELRAFEHPMTKLFWALSILVFAACLAVDASPKALLYGFRDSTSLRFGELFGPFVGPEPFRLLSAAFVHGGALHIFFNSGALLYLGRFVEGEFGSARFAILFVLSVIGGFALAVFWNPYVRVVGASGGIFGLIGAMTAMFLVRRDPVLKKAVVQMLIYALIMTFIFPGISVTAHLGGLATGVAVGFLFELDRRRRTLDKLMVVLAVLAVGASVGSIILANRSPVWKEVRLQEEMRGAP
jgi:membrane associated rhomboid family serine protease